MILQNREGLQEFDIPEKWYKNRENGISAMVRVKNSERWIGPCLEGLIKSKIFDEIVITIDKGDGKDRSFEIIENFQKGKIKDCERMADRIKMYEYPFALVPEINGDCYPDSVHDQAYYTNWTMSKTTKKVVCRWDSDMIIGGKKDVKCLRKLALKKNIVRLRGYDISSFDPFTIVGYDHYEPRFTRINKYLYWYQATEKERATQFKEERCKTLPLCKLEKFTYDNAKLYNPLSPMWDMRFNNWITRNDIYVKKPVYFHTKYFED
jgi:hypothetical protein